MTRRHKREKGTELTPFKPGWIGEGIWKGNRKLSDAQLLSLYDFYLLKTPCENLSASSKGLPGYGWGQKPWSTKGNRLYGKLLTEKGLKTNETLFVCTATDETKELFKESSLTKGFHRNLDREIIAFYNYPNYQYFMSILRHIRNSLAHGRFAAYGDDEPILCFEDVYKKGGECFVRARMLIRYETLKDWACIISKDEGRMQ